METEVRTVGADRMSNEVMGTRAASVEDAIETRAGFYALNGYEEEAVIARKP